MKKMTKKTLDSYRKMMDDLYDFMYEIIGNKTTFSVEITRWKSREEYLSFMMAIADPETGTYDTDKSFMKTAYSNSGIPVEDVIAETRQFVLDNYKD